MTSGVSETCLDSFVTSRSRRRITAGSQAPSRSSIVGHSIAAAGCRTVRRRPRVRLLSRGLGPGLISILVRPCAAEPISQAEDIARVATRQGIGRPLAYRRPTDYRRPAPPARATPPGSRSARVTAPRRGASLRHLQPKTLQHHRNGRADRSLRPGPLVLALAGSSLELLQPRAQLFQPRLPVLVGVLLALGLDLLPRPNPRA